MENKSQIFVTFLLFSRALKKIEIILEGIIFYLKMIIIYFGGKVQNLNEFRKESLKEKQVKTMKRSRKKNPQTILGKNP